MGVLLIGFPLFIAWRMIRRVVDFVQVPYEPWLFIKQLSGEALMLGAIALFVVSANYSPPRSARAQLQHDIEAAEVQGRWDEAGDLRETLAAMPIPPARPDNLNVPYN